MKKVVKIKRYSESFRIFTFLYKAMKYIGHDYAVGKKTAQRKKKKKIQREMDSYEKKGYL